ncbi:MAG TPA: sterol desaturase family protein, partial [Pseudomonadales bacterium]|nr:sterol desaturase family protein [Pseudomonadales bacterium]
KLIPRVAAVQPRSRALINISLTLINTLILRLVFPVLAVQFAWLMQNHAVGLFHWLELPAWLEIALAFLMLDAGVYWQHRLFHVFPWLWRFHRVHHCDIELDVTTALRFHPGEAVLSMLIKLSLIAVLGADPLAVLLFELCLNLGALFSHANIKIHRRLEPVLRAIIVTPDMHRLHHSILAKELNRNFGFFLSVWDRLFKSYLTKSPQEIAGTRIGLNRFRERADQQIGALLLNPLKSELNA